MTFKIFIITWLVILSVISMSQLTYPLDAESQEILRKVIHQMMPGLLWDNWWNGIFYYSTFFENIDVTGTNDAGWFHRKTGTAVPDSDLNGNRVQLSTGTTSGNNSIIEKTPSNSAGYKTLDFQKKSRFRTQVRFDTSVASMTGFAMAGSGRLGVGYGFKVVNGALTGVVYSDAGTEYLTPTLATLSTANYYLLEAHFTPQQQVVFYVDNTQRGVLTAILPNTSAPQLGEFYLSTQNNSNKTMLITFFEFIQEK